MQRASPTNRVWKEGRIVKKNLWKAGLAGILALAAMGPAPAQARMATKFRPAAHAGVLTDGQIHRMKAELKLTRLQEQYWPPIEAALREMARELSHHSAGGEGRAAAVHQAQVQRLPSLADPPVHSPRETQKRHPL